MSLWFCNSPPLGMLLSLDRPSEYGIEMLPSDSFMSNLYFQIGYQTGELIVHVVSSAVD